MIPWRRVLFLVGRLLFGGFFFLNGVNHFANAGQIAAEAAGQGVPTPLLAAYGTGLLLFVGGLAVILGALPRLGAALIAIFLGGVTPVMHAYWTFEDPQTRFIQFVNFTKNLALLGACLFLIAFPVPWAWSLRQALGVPTRRAHPS